MDPLTIGASVVTILTPYVADAGKQLLATVGEAGVEKTKELMHWLKARFAGDPVATTDLTRFEKDPAGYAKPLQDTIDSKVKEDPAFSTEIAKRVDDLAPAITIIQKFKNAKNMTGLQGDTTAGQVAVTQEGETAENVVGVKGNVGR